MRNVFSIDVEDYFHPTEVQAGIDIRRWKELAPRVHLGTRLLLDILAEHNVKATCFILGWVAEEHPSLVQEIAAAGHEIGVHSFAHQLVYDLTPLEFRRDTERAVRAIQDACGVTPRCYRAPSCSITERSFWALEILAEMGFTHDSSIYPIKHDRYGIPGFSRQAQTIDTPSGRIVEVPIATVQLSKTRIVPVGSGGYLRLLPYRYTAAGLRRINEEDGQPACLYIHPWEVDPEQPRLAQGFIARLRTYTGLGSVERKLRRLMSDFQFSTLTSVHPADTVPAPAGRPQLSMSGKFPIPMASSL